MLVIQTITMSTAASGKFLSPNWIGVKIKLATRFTPKGTATIHGNFFRNACTNTKPNVIRMIG